jgi:hypothetical protein
MRCVVLVIIVSIDGNTVGEPIFMCDVTSPYQRDIGDDDSTFSNIVSYLFVCSFIYHFCVPCSVSQCVASGLMDPMGGI